MMNLGKNSAIHTNDDNSQHINNTIEDMKIKNHPNAGLISYQEIMMTKEIIEILGILKKYLVLIDFKQQLVSLDKISGTMKKLEYDLTECNYIIDIQTKLDSFHAYTVEPHIIKNVNKLNQRMDLLLKYLNENLIVNPPQTSEEYVDTLDSFKDQIENLIDYVSTKSIFSE